MIKKIINVFKSINLSKLHRREKRTIFIGGIVVAAILIYYIFTWYASVKTSTYEKAEAKKIYLSKQLAKISDKESIIKKLEAGRNELKELEKGLIKGDKPAVAAAELQRLCREIAMTSGVDIRTEKTLNPVDSGIYYSIPIEIGFQVTTSKLKDMLLKIETSPFLLTVPEMRIRVININNPADVYVTLTVAGIFKKDIKQNDNIDKSKVNNALKRI